jgi:hypothetical protein
MSPSRRRPAPGRTGVLVVRVWLEEDPPGQLRARLTQAAGLSEPPTTLATAAGVRGVCDAVEAWLQGWLREQAGGDAGVTRR